MERIWMAISPSSRHTRVLATAGPHDTLLKAVLSPHPRHPRALYGLLEALALWEGRRVHAVLAAGESFPWSAWDPAGDLLGVEHTPLYTLDLVHAGPGRPRRRELSGLGDFRDLHGLLRAEVAR